MRSLNRGMSSWQASAGVLSSSARLQAARDENRDRGLGAAAGGGGAQLLGVADCDLLEPCGLEPARDLEALEPEPAVVLLDAQPLVRVGVGVGDDQTAAGFERRRHGGNRRRR